jgi:hypothetical protein
MIYKADINELPLSVFIEVYTNEKHGVCFDIPTDEAVSKVVGEYMNIVGGKQIAAEVVEANRRLNLALMVDCMTACENLMLLERWKCVCEVLRELGYCVKEDDQTKIRQRVQTLKSKAEYDLSKEKSEDKPKERPTKEQLTRERVTVMKYNKMQIDPKTMTAGEYAWLVKQTCDEIEELNRKHRK